MKPFNTAADVVRYIEQNYSNPKALNYQNEDDSGWEFLSTAGFAEQVRFLTLGLRNLGVKKGDKVGILANSSTRWTIADLAIMMAGGVTIPLFANISDENFEFEVNQTELKHIFVAGDEQWEKLYRHEKLFKTVISLYDELSHHQAVRYKELIEQGRTVDSQQPRLYKELGDNLKPTDLATIVYTSGSTGVPKGAMLNHENIIGLIHTDPFNWDSQKDSYISVLPLAHIFARSLNFIMIAWGISVYYVRDLKTIADVCREIHPTTFVLVPRILEKIYLKMVSKAENEGFLKRTIAMWAFTLANNEEESWYKQLLHPLADKVVYSSIRDALGGNLRVVISGGAALNPHLYHFFLDIGVPIFEGWGLTEAATVTCNRIGNIKIGTVGLPFEGMEVKISSEGEILVKGRIVMQGYFKNEEATAKSFTSDGWLRTGDKGHLDSDGFLTIEGRMKELYKSSTGEYIAPVPIEQELSNVPLIDMAMVIADGKKFASCLLFPNFDVIKSLKIAHNMENMSNEEFLNSFFVKEEMKKLFDNLNKHLNHWEEIRDYRFILAAPTVEGGELTPTMKIKREVIAKKYQNLIDSMYAQEAKI